MKKQKVAVVKPSDNDVFLLGQSDKNVLVFNLTLLNSKGKSYLELDETDALSGFHSSIFGGSELLSQSPDTSIHVTQCLNYVSEIAIKRHFLCIVLSSSILSSKKKQNETKNQNKKNPKQTNPNPNQSVTGNIYLEGRGKCPGAGMELGASAII